MILNVVLKFVIAYGCASECAGARFFDVDAFRARGYAILEGILNSSEVDTMSKQVAYFFDSSDARFRRAGIPHFMKWPALEHIFFRVNGHPLVRTALRLALGVGYRFCSHSYISIDKFAGGWHKDRLNGFYQAFEVLDPWETLQNGDKFAIVKLMIYLEDHSDVCDDSALTVIPGSHNISHIPVQKSRKRGLRVLRPRKGDAVLIDQRITHRGSVHGSKVPSPTDVVAACKTFEPTWKHRILVMLGYGANNTFTDRFEEGTIARLDAQDDPTCNYKPYSECALQRISAQLPEHKANQLYSFYAKTNR